MQNQPKILTPLSRQSWLSKLLFGEKPNCFKVTCFRQSSYVCDPDSVFYHLKEKTQMENGTPLFAFDNFDDAKKYVYSWGQFYERYEIYSAIGRDPVAVPYNILARPDHFKIQYYWMFYEDYQKSARQFPFELTSTLKGTVLYMSIELKKKVWG